VAVTLTPVGGGRQNFSRVAGGKNGASKLTKTPPETSKFPAASEMFRKM
jgi:hypothetical protein